MTDRVRRAAHRIQGDKGNAMPPMREIQDGIMWGFDTDAFEVNQFRPFQTFMLRRDRQDGGWHRGEHARSAASIAHRSHAEQRVLFFRENDLGSIQSGRFADLVVIDKDYLTVPADQIKDIKSVLTMVGVGWWTTPPTSRLPPPSKEAVVRGSRFSWPFSPC